MAPKQSVIDDTLFHEYFLIIKEEIFHKKALVSKAITTDGPQFSMKGKNFADQLTFFQDKYRLQGTLRDAKISFS